ncbi:MAG: hypothetical protein CK426_08980 [Legionella sp.]|nr:MAG: hypothetical protein CK426_08980 [Legionella sp.]
MIPEADELRTPQNIHHPDPRAKYFGVVDNFNQHENISRFILSNTVPEEIAIHFATAKNLYLYAWHVYRFYPVAEQHAFSTLEYALRLRLHEYVEQFKQEKRDREPTLRNLLKYAIDTKSLKNELFPSRLSWATQIAKERFSDQVHRKMISDGLNEIIYDDSHVTPTEADLNYDWLSDFLIHIPRHRNDLAHGSSTLIPSVLHTFDGVSSIINQLYPESDSYYR